MNVTVHGYRISVWVDGHPVWIKITDAGGDQLMGLDFVHARVLGHALLQAADVAERATYKSNGGTKDA